MKANLDINVKSPYGPKYSIVKICQAYERDDMQHGEGADSAHLGGGDQVAPYRNHCLPLNSFYPS